jgi:rfaE bifunctional protein kinase chain/domain
MTIKKERFHEITARYSKIKVAVIGDFCLDRYLEIDPDLKETSIETGLDVFNVVNVMAQPGGAGTILNNLSALGIGKIFPVGFCGNDGEGYELFNALSLQLGVDLRMFLKTDLRRTFTYCKPLKIKKGNPPTELNRLDFKNWHPTPSEVESIIINFVSNIYEICSAAVVLEQVDIANTGVVTDRVLRRIGELRHAVPTIADSRRGLQDYPPLIYKMNLNELSKMVGKQISHNIDEIKYTALALSRKTGSMVFVTLGEKGIIGAFKDVEYVPAIPPRGEIDIVGAGDAVTANLISSLAAGATLKESIEIANAGAFVVIHKLGTTGTASIEEISSVLFHN